MVGIVTALVDALRDRRDVFWAGKRPPRFDMVCSTDIYDPARDFRVAPSDHQKFGLVFLVEADFGAFKQWPLILDEALRLVAPGGIMVLRSRQNTHFNPQEIASFIGKWTGGYFELISQHLVGADWTLSIRLTTTHRRLVSSGSWTFGLIADQCERRNVKSFIKSVEVLESNNDIDVEIVICGPGEIAGYVTAIDRRIKFIAVDARKDSMRSTGTTKNALVKAASKENVLIINEGGVLSPDFASAARAFGGDFDCIVPRQLSHSGVPMPDWVMTENRYDALPAGWLDHGDYHPMVYPGETVTIAKRALLADIRWNEVLLPPLSEQLDLGRRLQDAGVTLRLARQMTVIVGQGKTYTLDRYQRLPWLEDDYVGVDARGRHRDKIAIPPITRDFDLRFGVGDPDPRLFGVILPSNWEKSMNGYVWAVADEPTISLQLTEQVDDVSLTLSFSHESNNVIGASVNEREESVTSVAMSRQCMSLSLDAASLPSSGNLHVHLHRRDLAEAVLLEGLALRGVRKRPNCVLGVPVPIHAEGNSILVSGWNEPEPWGVWASRSRADIKLRPSQLPDNVRIRLGLQIALLTGGETASVVVSVAGTVMSSAAFSEAASKQHVDFVIPAALVVDDYLLISLTSDYVVSATRSGNENDLRKLGVGLVSIIAEEAPLASIANRV